MFKMVMSKVIPYMRLLSVDDKGKLSDSVFCGSGGYYKANNICNVNVVTAQFEIWSKMRSPYDIMRLLEYEFYTPDYFPEQVWIYLKAKHADWIRDRLPVEKRLMMI